MTLDDKFNPNGGNIFDDDSNSGGVFIHGQYFQWHQHNLAVIAGKKSRDSKYIENPNFKISFKYCL